MDYDYTIKTVVVGDAGVGKSSILKRFVDNNFEDLYASTIGIDLRIKRMEIKNKNIKLHLWDTAGQERFRSIVRTYYRNANIILICYDMTNKNTYDNVKKWIDEVRVLSENSHIAIIGNKLDLKKDNLFEKKYDCQLYETSAKTGENIDAIFNDIISNYLEKIMDTEDELITINSHDFNTTKYKNRCCQI